MKIKRKMAKRWGRRRKAKQTKTENINYINQIEKKRVVDDKVEKEDIFIDKKKTRERNKNTRGAQDRE